MQQTNEILQTLKRALKSHGKTYADVAEVLDLSEASVKRLFADGNISLQRLEQILQMLVMDFTELVELVRQARQQVALLSREQEAQIAADTPLLVIALSVINGFSFADLQQHYRFDTHMLVQKLAQLDRLKMLELLPGNRIRLRIAHNFRWRKDGPIQSFFLKRIAQDFFSGRFDSENEKLLVINTVISSATNAEVQQAMEAFVNQMYALIEKDKLLPISDRHGNTLVVALRQWQANLFREHLSSQMPQALSKEEHK